MSKLTAIVLLMCIGCGTMPSGFETMSVSGEQAACSASQSLFLRDFTPSPEQVPLITFGKASAAACLDAKRAGVTDINVRLKIGYKIGVIAAKKVDRNVNLPKLAREVCKVNASDAELLFGVMKAAAISLHE